MSSVVRLEPVQPKAEAITRALDRLIATHSTGGAFLAALRVGANDAFDWFASRNRLVEFDILPQLLSRDELRSQLPDVKIPGAATEAGSDAPQACSVTASNGFRLDDPFLLDGQLAHRLFAGGAYPPESKITGRAAMQPAAEYCEAVFERRYEEVSLFTSYEAWTPWFCGVAWDWTSVLFDRANRILWTLVVTDSD